MTVRRPGTFIATAALIVTVGLSAHPLPILAEQGSARTFQVTMTNLSAEQVLSPPLLVTHADGFELFAVGEQAREGLRIVAEEGNNAVLAAELADVGQAYAVVA